MKHIELFAGIGGFRRALDLLTQDNVMRFESVGFSEIDNSASKTYKANFEITPAEVEMGDIVAFTQDRSNIEALPDFGLLTAGFPCQAFSMMGKQQGFNEDRGQMFFRIKDILEVKRPKYVLLENVKNLYTHDKGNTFKVIKNDLESLGYYVYTAIFNTSSFHLPQTRNRVLIFATTESGHDWLNEKFNCETISAFFDSVYHETSVVSFNSVLDLLAKDVNKKYFLSERIKPTILSDGSGGFKSRSDIDLRIARPLTATMHKMHRACQDNYYSIDFINTEGKNRPSESLTKEELSKLPIRRLTPVEAFSLQGFPVEFALRASEKKVADGALYKQAGNAVSVNVIYAVVYFLISKGVIKE